MSLEGQIIARFRLALRCHNCRQKAISVVSVPGAEDAPCDIDDLLASEFLARQPFKCSKCDNPSAELLAVTTIELRPDA